MKTVEQLEHQARTAQYDDIRASALTQLYDLADSADPSTVQRALVAARRVTGSRDPEPAAPAKQDAPVAATGATVASDSTNSATTASLGAVVAAARDLDKAPEGMAASAASLAESFEQQAEQARTAAEKLADHEMIQRQAAYEAANAVPMSLKIEPKHGHKIIPPGPRSFPSPA